MGQERKAASERRLRDVYRVTRRRLLFPGQRYRRCEPRSVLIFRAREMRAGIIRSARVVGARVRRLDKFFELVRRADAIANRVVTALKIFRRPASALAGAGRE